MIEFGVLVAQCASGIDYPIAHAIVQRESGFKPFAIGVNKAAAVKQPKTYNEAVYKAKQLLAQGYNIDLGLAQINSNNLKWLGLSVEQVLDPCQNMKAMQTVYLDCYTKAGENGMGTRIQRAFSCYNTGSSSRGFANGYVQKVTTNFNNYLAGNSSNKIGINRKSLPKNGEDLAIYANNLNLPSNRQISVNPAVQTENTEDAQVEEVQYASWDIFKDF